MIYRSTENTSRKNRTKEMIWYDILTTALEPTSRTSIMNKVFINFKHARKHTKYLEEKGYIIYMDKKYETTSKGREFMSIFEQFMYSVDDTREKAKKLNELLGYRILREAELKSLENPSISRVDLDFRLKEDAPLEPYSESYKFRLDILLKLLDLAKEQRGKTWMMHKIGTTHSIIGRYMDFLTSTSMMEHRDRMFSTTEKGKMLLDLFSMYNIQKVPIKETF